MNGGVNKVFAFLLFKKAKRKIIIITRMRGAFPSLGACYFNKKIRLCKEADDK